MGLPRLASKPRNDSLLIKVHLRQHRIIQVCGLCSKIFRQSVQIIGRHTDVWVPIFGQSDGIRFKQGARRELCGGALSFFDRYGNGGVDSGIEFYLDLILTNGLDVVLENYPALVHVDGLLALDLG